MMNRTVADDTASPTTTPAWKRLLDWCFILVTLPISLPVCLAISLFIKLTSTGPVLFTQTRVGRNGRPFVCYKFRTMKVNASSAGHEQHLASLMTSNAPMTKMDRRGDARIIAGGRLLRSAGLDELPQLLNVVKGEMSMVGPRPCLPYEFALYTDRHKQRLAVVPGLTGLWQVTGKNRTTFEEMIDLDIAYARQLSLPQDLSIMARTGAVLIRQLLEAFDRPSPALPGTVIPVRDRA